MSHNLLLAALILGSANASAANDATFNLLVTPANGGSDTLISWSYTGAPTFGPTAVTGSPTTVTSIRFGSGSFGNAFFNVSGATGRAFEIAPATVTGLSTGLVLTNTTTLDYRTVDRLTFQIFPNLAFISFTWQNTSLQINANEVAVLSGPTSGSFLSGVAFTNFSSGIWTLDQGAYYNFDPVLTVSGTPVPEPSTYGLALGGLALVGAVIRRRKASK